MKSQRRQLDQQLWVVDFPDHCSAGLHLGTRSTLIETAQGLWIHSPGPLGSHLDGLLAPFALVAPNSMHYLYLAENCRRFPQAQAWAPAELLTKVPGLPARLLTGPQAPELECLPLAGLGRLGEWVFFHRASRSLIVTDLVFHLLDSPHFWTRLVMRLNGAYGRLAPSRLFRALFVKSHEELRLSLQKVLAWDFDRLVLAHGEVLERGGKDALRTAFRWLGPL